MKRALFILLVPILFISVEAVAQNGNSQVSYSNLALQFSSQYANSDAATGYFPSVASANGFGGYMDNPASVALMKSSQFSFGLLNDRAEFSDEYLGNTLTSDDKSTKLGNIGFVYKMPTRQGSFVFGAGYNNINHQKGTHRLSARNNASTITDAFRENDSDYNDIAFDTYAIDWGDTDSTYLESIFRIGFAEYPGIQQEVQLINTTNLGEYSAFLGTEFQKDFYVGVSAGLISGTYKYRRKFLELDENDDYNETFIPSDDGQTGTDIYSILVEDEIDADIFGLTLSAGLIYRPFRGVQLGASYVLPSTLVVRENYYSSITTELDDGSTPFQSDFASNQAYEYRISKPGKLSLGFALTNFGRFNLAASAEIIDHSNLRLDLVSGNDLSFNDEVNLIDQQNELDAEMENQYRMVTNIKTSLGFNASEQIQLKAGYAYLPAKSKVYESVRNIISGGLNARISNQVILDINAQYSFWDDRSILYDYYDYENNPSGVPRAESFSQEAEKWKIMAGIRFLF